jgi:tRNA(Ile)-lysidine synthase TilS/MesJ
VLLHKGEPICQSCLFKNIEYKTRLVLENSFKVTKNSNLLLCFSGGLSSICMVSIIVNIVKRYQKNKLFNRFGCVHVQQQQALPEGFAERFEKETGVELHIIKIEDIMREGERNLDNMRNLLKQFANTANTIDLITVFRDRLIADFAKQHNYDFILKGLNA